MNQSLVVSRLSAHPRRDRVHFALGCAERLAPTLGRHSGPAALNTLVELLDSVWTSGDTLTGAQRAQLRRQCADLEPAIEGNPSAWASAALNAVHALAAAIDCGDADDARCCGEAAELVTDTIYLAMTDHIDPNDPEHWTKVLANPVMAQELSWQQDDLASIENEASPETLRIRAQERGRQLCKALERLLFAA